MSLKSDDRKISLVIDGSYILSKYAFVLPSYLNSRLEDVAVISSFLKYITNIAMNYDSCDMHIVFDIGRDLKKTKMYENYKKNRVKVSNDIFLNKLNEIQYRRITDSRQILINILETTAIKCYPIPLVEGDTVVGYIANRLSNEDKKVYVVSGDRDMIQLVNNNISMLIPKNYKQKHDTLLNNSNLVDIWKQLGVNIWSKKEILMTSHDTVYFKSIIGDKSDGIVGISRLGKKFIEKLINSAIDMEIDHFDNDDNFIEFVKKLRSSHYIDRYKISQNSINKFLNNLKHYKLNCKLIDIFYAIDDLPVNSLVNMKEIYETTPTFLKSKFMEYCYGLELHSVDDINIMYNVMGAIADNTYDNLETSDKNRWFNLYRTLS